MWFYARLSREIPGEEPMPNIASGIWARLAELGCWQASHMPGVPPLPPPLPENLGEWLRSCRKVKTRSRFVPSSKLPDSVTAEPMPDSVTRLRTPHERRAAEGAAKRANLKCRTCAKPLADAQRATARYCNVTISGKPVGIAAVSQVRITKADNFGLWPQSVRTPDALLCTPTTCPLHFWNYRRRFMVT